MERAQPVNMSNAVTTRTLQSGRQPAAPDTIDAVLGLMVDGDRSPGSSTEAVLHIILIGLRGSGKSTLTRELAGRLQRPALDLDDETIRELNRKSVADAWADFGESGFRRGETTALRTVLAREQSHVIALGGGTPTAPDAAELLRDAQRRRKAILVYLRAAPGELRARLEASGGAGGDRPSLTGDDPLDEIEKVHAQRDPLYQSLADAILEVGGLNVDAATEQLIAIADRLDADGQAAAE